MPDSKSIPLDVVIFGGGVAGLWLLDDLRRAGYRALLLEANALGHGQTVASQGIIHGGFKYSLKGIMNASARAVAEMPVVWREALAGQREPDLSATTVRAHHCHMWVSEGQRGSRTIAATKLMLRVRPESLPESEWPSVLRRAKTVYRLDEQVIDPVGMVEAFANRHVDHLLKIDASSLRFERRSDESWVIHCTDPASGRTIALAPRRIVLTAGAGNARLREMLNLPTSVMQRRPLHMVMIRGVLPDLNGHCIDRFKTRMTITTALRGKGMPAVWQVGGQLAEDGVDMDSEHLMNHALHELDLALPSLPLAGTQWATYRIDRAESANDGKRPETACTLVEGPIITAWPTKLALAPELSRNIAKALPKPAADGLDISIDTIHWPRPEVADAPWDQPQQWLSYEKVALG